MGYTYDDTKVRADLFSESGKWKYTVTLDYNGGDWNNWNLWEEAEKALERATRNNVSGVVTKKIPEGWWLVVLEPYGKNGYPIMVRGK